MNINIVICRPFSENWSRFSKMSTVFAFVDEESEQLVSEVRKISKLKANGIFIENSLFEKIHGEDEHLALSLSRLQDFVTPGPRKKVVFLASSDTHVEFLRPLWREMKDRSLFFIPYTQKKDELASRVLSGHEIPYSELSPEILQSLELTNTILVSATDWTSEYIALNEIGEKCEGYSSLVVQEGPQDAFFDIKKLDGTTLKPLHYRNADTCFIMGEYTLKELLPNSFAITGSTKFGTAVSSGNDEKTRLVMINYNFSYLDTKPKYEQSGGDWLAAIVEVCEELEIDFFISLHPRAELPTWASDLTHIKSSASTVRSQIMASTEVISRFSTVIYESLIEGVRTAYFNPHSEPMPTFQTKREGGPFVALNKGDLREFLLSTEIQIHSNSVNNPFLRSHISSFIREPAQLQAKILESMRVGRVSKVPIITRSDSTDYGELPLFHDREAYVFSEFSRDSYSGGRYQSLMIAEALAAIGFQVKIISKDIPHFFQEYGHLPGHQNIEFLLDKNFRPPLRCNSKPALCVMVPGLNRTSPVYSACKEFVSHYRVPFIFLSFETPHLFNSTASNRRPLSDWQTWLQISHSADAILVLTQNEIEFAAKFYKKPTASIWHISPPINDFEIRQHLGLKKNPKKILVPTRVKDPHKGFNYLLSALGPELNGTEIAVICETLDHPKIRSLQKACSEFDIDLQLHVGVTEEEKMALFAESAVLFNTSTAEGYGLTIAEALSVGTYCVAFDLPSFENFTGDTLKTVPVGNSDELRFALYSAIRDGNRPSQFPDQALADKFSFRKFSSNLSSNLAPIFENISNQDKKIVLNWKQRSTSRIYTYLIQSISDALKPYPRFWRLANKILDLGLRILSPKR